IDGSLMEGITGDSELQERVSEYIAVAKQKRIATVAERVEDANTMAVLWQLGIEYIQGFYVQGPEEIVLESDD
ncbi:MAG: EAL domain-containing protein, partial [Pseudomonadota bacterium]